MPESTSPIDGHGGRPPLQRDNQQWILDYLIQQTGKVFHFQGEGRGRLPKSVHSHAMIPKHMGRRAQALERFARTEADLGHRDTALDIYYEAAFTFAHAQHTVMDLNDEKRFLYEGLRRCYDRVAELAPYPLERVQIEWGERRLFGNLHLCPTVDGPAPVVVYIPGCDVTKESWPHPHFNQAHQRGMHVFAFDGPGQGESLVEGVVLTADNYEAAASAAIDYLIARPEVDPEGVLVYATSFGSYWGLRLAALDRRVKATVAVQASICEKYIQTDLESPRWKQLFAFLTQAESEEELDSTMKAMTMEGRMGDISSPILMTVGEYDPRAPLKEIYPLFDQVTAPAELWVMSDQHHSFNVGGGPDWARNSHAVLMDWLRDRFDGKELAHVGEVVYVEGPAGPNAPGLPTKRFWYEE
jgi:cephalosporin-C deacetylase-like acetyl esterase